MFCLQEQYQTSVAVYCPFRELSGALLEMIKELVGPTLDSISIIERCGTNESVNLWT